MSEFKFNVGEAVQLLNDAVHQGTITGQFRGAENWYLVRCGPDDERAWAELSIERVIEEASTKPLDANGQEIGVGDLVEYLEAHDEASCGRVYRIANGLVFVRFVFELGRTRDDDLLPAKLVVLEKAPPPQITLGSQVRVKSTGQKFIVRWGPMWSDGDRYSLRESELELIE